MNWRSGFGLIPGPAKILAALNFVVFFFWTFDHHREIGPGTLIGLAGATLAGAWVLLVNLFVVFILVVQLYGTLVLAERRAGYIIMFVGSALGLLISVIHMKGARGLIGGDIGTSSQAFLFVWTILALGITATFFMILSARELLSLPWHRSRRASTAA